MSLDTAWQHLGRADRADVCVTVDEIAINSAVDLFLDGLIDISDSVVEAFLAGEC